MLQQATGPSNYHDKSELASNQALRAIKQGDFEIINKLIDEGQLNEINYTLLVNACEYDRKHILRKFIKIGANINQTNEDLMTCLMVTANYNCLLFRSNLFCLIQNGCKPCVGCYSNCSSSSKPSSNLINSVPITLSH